MKYYLTTPIYYTNGTPHLGHAYCTLVADLIRRFKRMQGCEAILTTGTDEHGVNVERSARSAGMSPRDFCDRLALEWRKEWDRLGFEYDHFIRTSDPKHHETVRWLFERCQKNGYIYEGVYSGQYCVFDNLFVDAKPGDPCPDCGRPTETVSEPNYFFKLSAFRDKLLDLYERQPGFIRPESRRNEIISFVQGELKDLSITRTTIEWGIPAPVPGKHVIYVWFDALVAYLSSVREQVASGGEPVWPADLHLIGKEIIRFHAVYWPAFLMAAELPLPKRLFAHGWLLFEQDKMSKSRGNVVRPEPIRQVVGVDAMRYYLLREVVFGQDGSFSYDALVGRYNSDLANGLGNLVSRTLTLVRQHGGAIPPGPGDAEIANVAGETIAALIASFENFEYSKGLESLWALLSAVDRFLVQKAPWKLAKQTDDASRAELHSTLYTAADTVRIAAALLAPVLPDSMPKIWRQLGMTTPLESVRLDSLKWGQLPAGQKVGDAETVFPRLDVAETVKRLREVELEIAAQQAALVGKAPAAAAAPAESSNLITIDDFGKIDLRVGLVLSAEPVKGADKLLHLKVDIGEAEPRTIVAGIAEAYKPADLPGRKVVIVANLQPRKLRGLTSQGMIVAASLESGKPVLAGFHEDIAPGARLK
ncbi:MAG: methionine--tRNA ligase [Bryobacteraceae bacterium]